MFGGTFWNSKIDTKHTLLGGGLGHGVGDTFAGEGAPRPPLYETLSIQGTSHEILKWSSRVERVLPGKTFSAVVSDASFE